MTLFFYKTIAALLIFLASMVTALYLLKKHRIVQPGERSSLFEALASGIFLGAAFFHMLPDSLRSFQSIYPDMHYPIAELICVGGFLLMLLLERLSLASNDKRASGYIPYILTLTLIIHSISEGAALGLESAFAETTMLFIAILAHKSTETFGLCILLLRYALPYQRVLLILLIFSLMTPLGILLGNYLISAHGSQEWAAIFTAFAAGTFLYISTLHHVHFHQHEGEKEGMMEFGCLAAGTIVMGLIGMWT